MTDKPYIRFEGDSREQETFFIEDPSGNVLEIKTMFDPGTLFPDQKLKPIEDICKNIRFNHIYL